jgi:SAM-dependent methyltransferase
MVVGCAAVFGMITPNIERDYVLGTHDAEVQRLRLQHVIWRARSHDAWRRAGIRNGSRVADIGAGPGWAALDIAELVGHAGHVYAIDQSSRFLTILKGEARARGLDHITAIEKQLDGSALPVTELDAAWCRWIFAFVTNPRALLSSVLSCLRPHGMIVIHEYFDYSTWRFSPRSDQLEDLVALIMRNWRDNGGDSDVGLHLPVWLREAGCEIIEIRTIVDIVTRDNSVWRWPVTYMRSALERLVEFNALEAGKARDLSEVLEGYEREPNSFMVTPGVVEIIARRM